MAIVISFALLVTCVRLARPTVELPDVLEKEAVYCAIGRCAARMSNVIPFNQWVDTILLPEVMNPNPKYAFSLIN